LSVNPARILGVPGGTLSEGAPADVAVFDLVTERPVDPSTFKTKGRNTPYQGWNLKGWTVMTLVGGEVKYERSNEELGVRN
jgi:dihydroorotase